MKQQQHQNEATAVTSIISDRRLAANRANAALSTGPRTQAGKAASSRNAVSHGLTASQLTIFNWECPVEYAQLRSDYFTRFCPIDTSESDVVDRLVDSTWRRRRALVIETTLFDMEISMAHDTIAEMCGETADGPLHLAIAFRNRHGEGVWDAILRLLNAVDCAYSRALRDLQKLQAERFNVLPPSYLKPADDVGQDTDTTPLEPETELVNPAENPLVPLSTQNKIIEITKQTQPKAATTPAAPAAVEAIVLPAATKVCKNEPIAFNDDRMGISLKPE